MTQTKAYPLMAAALAAMLLSGCAQSGGTLLGASQVTPVEEADGTHLAGSDSKPFHAGFAPFFASDNSLASAKVHFRRGDFGLAEQDYRKAVELAPRDAEAWLGLAASYDRLRRFDMADRAYAKLRKLVGNNVQVLNDLGYSHLLRGKLPEARKYFLMAYEMEPDNEIIRNNLELLNSSARYIERVKT